MIKISGPHALTIHSLEGAGLASCSCSGMWTYSAPIHRKLTRDNMTDEQIKAQIERAFRSHVELREKEKEAA